MESAEGSTRMGAEQELVVLMPASPQPQMEICENTKVPIAK